mmetsp:Transcript_22009/g.47203  ORF Transcript_22009/g.47203 Transcript_22009/m.47203 type:complete len:205 (-) Transcript_22009:845-1459(-)
MPIIARRFWLEPAAEDTSALAREMAALRYPASAGGVAAAAGTVALTAAAAGAAASSIASRFAPTAASLAADSAAEDSVPVPSPLPFLPGGSGRAGILRSSPSPESFLWYGGSTGETRRILSLISAELVNDPVLSAAFAAAFAAQTSAPAAAAAAGDPPTAAAPCMDPRTDVAFDPGVGPHPQYAAVGSLYPVVGKGLFGSNFCL